MLNTFNNPKVSIIILTKNGGELFKKSIRKIFVQKTYFSYEVIIVDSGSNDGTKEFLKDFPVKLYKIKPDEFSFGPTRDFGFSKASGECLVTLSQDAVPVDENWLSNLTKPILEDSAEVVQGNNLVPKDKEVFFWEKEGLFYFTCEGNRLIQSFGGIGLSCVNLSLKRKIWEENRFSPAQMNEDKKFQKSIYGKGYRIAYNKNAPVYHGHAYNVGSLMRRCENEGFGWKIIGEKYALKEMFKDLAKKWLYRKLIRGVFEKKITNLAEILFLFIRPVFIYKGNKFNKKYKF